jgi:hypothetical protein
MFAITMNITQHQQSFGEILYLQLEEAKTRAKRLEIAGKMLLGQRDGIKWLFHYLSNDDAVSTKAIFKLFRTLPACVEREVREFAAEDGEAYEVAVAVALRQIRRGLVDRVVLHPTSEVLAVHYPAAFGVPR